MSPTFKCATATSGQKAPRFSSCSFFPLTRAGRLQIHSVQTNRQREMHKLVPRWRRATSWLHTRCNESGSSGL